MNAPLVPHVPQDAAAVLDRAAQDYLAARGALTNALERAAGFVQRGMMRLPVNIQKLAAERARVSEELRSLDDDSERFDRDLRRRNAEWIMAARIELGRVHAPIENPGALESIGDLFPSERLKAAQISREAIAEHLQRRARGEEDGKATKGRNPLAGLPVEPIRDPATDATEAQATLSAIDAALKPTTVSR